MQADTSMKLNVKGNVNTNEIAKVIRKALLSKATDPVDETNINNFCDELEIKSNQIIEEGGWALSSWEFEYLREALVAIATENDCEFTFEADHHSLNCGYEAFIEAEYKNGVLTIREIASEDMMGCCSDFDEGCGELIVHAFDYDPSKTYICPECGRVVPEEELFPDGVPTWEVEEIRIK